MNNLQLGIIFRPFINTDSDIAETYAFWKRVWSEAYLCDFEIKNKLTSDNFLSQDIIFYLINDSKIVSLITLKKFDLSKNFYRDSSYFDCWPTEVLDKLRQEGSQYWSCGNLTVCKSTRGKSFEGFKLKDIHFGIIKEFLSNSSFDGVISATRNLRSVNLSAYRAGARCLKSNIEYTIPGQMVDLLYWSQKSPLDYADNNLKELSLKLLKTELLNRSHQDEQPEKPTRTFKNRSQFDGQIN